MAATSTKKLLAIFRERIEWKSRPDLIHDQDKIHWSDSHLLTVLDHVLEASSLNSDFCSPITTILWDNEEDWLRRLAPTESFSQLVVSFIKELQVLFMVPKLQQQLKSNALKKNEVVAAFIDFLVQLLSAATALLIFSFEDRIKKLTKELRFLVVVLGDTWLLGGEEDFLAEFEVVANEAGSLVYSLLFFATDIDRTSKTVGALLEQIEQLKANIIKFSNLPPSIITPNITPEAAAVDSSSVIVSLLRDLEELMNNRKEDDLIVSLKGQIKILHQGLMCSLSFLKDIKVLPFAEIEELKEVVMRIRDVAFEADYLINSFLVRDAPLWYLIIRIPNVIHKNKLIGDGIQEIKKNYDIGALKVAKDFSAQLSLQAKRNSVVEDIVVGFEDRTIDILDLLMGGKDRRQIISIIGMPGLGKTTLAKKLYNHPSVNYYFDKRSWCIVSQAYEMKSVLIDILISLEIELDRAIILDKEEKIAEHIYKSLKGRRYLIVMDDVWSLDVWGDLHRCFPDDGNGSRILFTSRNRDAAPPNSIIQELPTLSNEQCWELLQKKVFGNETCPSQLLDIGNQVAASCGGLPLAVVVVAGILSTMDRERITWKNVGGSLASYIFAEGNNSTSLILELSYKHLPDYLKPCFLYFGAFAKEKEIPVRKLERLWIAEGFICKEEGKSVESVAEEYLMELIGKSLVIVTGRRSDRGVKYCVIHDLLRDLCLRRAEEENFLKLDYKRSKFEKHQRLYSPFDYFSAKLTYKVSHLLSGWYVRHVRSYLGYILSSPLSVLNMELLRVLDCRPLLDPGDLDPGDLDGIGTLVYLRYLAINPMPTSIASLVNLEFLFVHDKVSISSSLLKMTKLRYLRANEAIFDDDCNSAQMINNLEYLSTVCIFKVKDEEMLKCSPHLRKLKCKCKPLLSEDEGASYRYPDLRFLTHLESLKMTTFYGDAISADINIPLNIKKLTLSGFSLSWEKMSIIGTLPNLEVLKLDDAFRGERWDTRDGEFQQLRFLKLVELEFAQWNVSLSEHFPKLQQLLLHDCSNLQEIPSEMGEIETLQLIEVDGCRRSVAESAEQIQEEQREMGNEELRIIIRNVKDNKVLSDDIDLDDLLGSGPCNLDDDVRSCP